MGERDCADVGLAVEFEPELEASLCEFSDG